MSNYSLSLSLLSLSLLAVFPCGAEDYYPEEFGDFFTETTQLVDLKINGLKTGVRLNATVTFDTFSLIDDVKAQDQLRQYLQQEYLKPELIELILTRAKQGIETDAACIGSLSTCKLVPQKGQIRYIYDFDAQVVKIFVAADGFLKKGHKKEYQSPYNPHHALVNNSRLNLGYNHTNTQSLTWSNDTTLGLPIGYLSLSSQYRVSNRQDNGNEFDLYRALYNAEYQDIRLQAGRSNYNLSFNTTDYLNNGMRLSGDVIGIGRSQNLLIGESARQQQYEYYVPQNGTLNIYRGSELILSRVVNEGLQIISYHELPRGVYSATIELNVAGQIIQSETLQIVNNNRYVLPLGEWDYVVTAGRFDKKDSTSDSGYQHPERSFGRLGVNYRLTQSWFFGAGLVSDRDDQYWQLGSSFYFGDKFRLDYSGGVFTSDENYQIATLSYHPFSVDFRRFDARPDKSHYRLSQQLFGESSYQDISVGAYGSLFGVQGYFRHSYYLSEDSVSGIEGLNQYKQELTTLGMVHPLLSGNLSVTASYTTYQNSSDQFSLSLSWSKSLGDNLSIQTNNYVNNDGFSRSINSANYSYQGDFQSATASAGIEFNRDYETTSNLSATYSLEQQYANLSTYAYLSDTGSRSVSANLSSTQVVTTDDLIITNEQGRAFAKVNVENMQGSALSSALYANVKEDSGYSHRIAIKGSSTVIALDEYDLVSVQLDQGTNNVELAHQSLEEFVKPGSLMRLDSELNPLTSHIIVFDDIFDQPIEDLTCIGDGCVNVEPLSDDGVYRINYRRNKPARFLSSKGLCIFDQRAINEYSFGFCLPSVQKGSPRWVQFDEIPLNNEALMKEAALLEENSNNDASANDEQVRFMDTPQGERSVNEESIIYLGQFLKGSESGNISKQLDESQIRYKRFDIGLVHYYYIFNTKALNLAQKILLREIYTYAIQKNIGKDELLGHQSEPKDNSLQTR